MAEHLTQELNALFVSPPATELPPDILGELQSILRLHSISAQELFYKWESYCIKMGAEETKLTLETVRAFKVDIQDLLEREIRGKTHVRSADKRGTSGATPRTVKPTSDRLSMLDGLVPQTPKPGQTGDLIGRSTKRKAPFQTPNAAQAARDAHTPANGVGGTPRGEIDSTRSAPFADRPNAGQIIESLNSEVDVPEPPLAPAAEARIKLTANTDLKKFSYRPMAMHLSEASEVLDDRIDEFVSLVQDHHHLPDNAFGNPATQGLDEIIAVGRIASDTLDSKLNTASLVLETSRRMGAGLRIPLKVDAVPAFEFFPGQIIAAKGVNVTGESFTVKEILEVPLLPPAASLPSTLAIHNDRLAGGPDMMEDSPIHPLNILLSSGPYTADDNLLFEPLHTLCSLAAITFADALILTGPFLDLEHPLLMSGDFDLPSDPSIDPDTANLTTCFRAWISLPLRRLAEAIPSITIIIIPSVRDAISKHVSWPQEPLSRKDLGLPKQARLVSNPVTVSLNEIVVAVSAHDVLSELRLDEVTGPKPITPNLLARLPRYLIQQRHFFPLFPPVARDRLPKVAATAANPAGLATGAMLDTSYLKLGEWLTVRPDVLITPSALPPFVKVVDSVLVINPGTLSKRKAPGTYARLTVRAAEVSGEEREAGKMVTHKVFERARVDVLRI